MTLPAPPPGPFYSAVDGNSRSHSQPGANAADPRHTHSDTAGPSLSAVEAGEPCPPNPGSPACHSETATAPSAEPVGDHCSGRGTSAEPDGSAAFPSPACPKTARGNSQEALAPAAFLADPAATSSLGGRCRSQRHPRWLARSLRADIGPASSARNAPDPEPAGEDPLPGAPSDPDPTPVRKPEPIDATPVASARPLTRAAKPGAHDVDWLAILARVDAGERPDMVALDEGIELKALQDRLRERIAATKAARPAVKPERVTRSWWTDARDLDLVSGIICDGIGKTVRRMGITEDAAKARWNELLPRKGLMEQSALLQRLRAKVGVAA